ncbi:hypothetical protein CC85DRAFT_284311 [Cutaneotrichosporon oleaginosum]|uniref:Uncharacterized protein n=1 Tax=Cutaneotrichosporon oleaginosum TaxID=879819 RepID=A0A0J0XR82_9TREE|nr:uncharacterized protein CC85DRAFT_284311 [Cutaneotrichosporon oleaginosum]KLT43603.1 hypothetical protein CC85DRAFT_284311 [Cutaneotrichosporon oleaginosum]TXT12729.1 hypothetical protein COLE_03139 [Cutaneotrichosporon oleaginosum]
MWRMVALTLHLNQLGSGGASPNTFLPSSGVLSHAYALDGIVYRIRDLTRRDAAPTLWILLVLDGSPSVLLEARQDAADSDCRSVIPHPLPHETLWQPQRQWKPLAPS